MASASSRVSVTRRHAENSMGRGNGSFRRVCGVVVGVAILFAWTVGQSRRARRKLYVNKRFKLQFLVPTGWQVSEQATHPTILVALRHVSGAGVRVSFKPIASRITLRAFARKEVQVIKKIGYRTGKMVADTLSGLPAVRVDGHDPKRENGFTQIYVLQSRKRGWVGFVLTMTYPLVKKNLLARSFNLVKLSFKFRTK